MQPYPKEAASATWLADAAQHNHVRAELLTSVEFLLSDQPKDIELDTAQVLSLWATFGNAVREYLRAEQLAADKAAEAARVA